MKYLFLRNSSNFHPTILRRSVFRKFTQAQGRSIMATPTIAPEGVSPEYLYGIVDIGSNGVRFSISSLHPLTSRVLPTVFSDRAAISLYDAQYAYSTISSANLKTPIPPATITAITTTLKRFKNICGTYQVPESHIRVVATEATRTAPNSAEFRSAIEAAVGWTVELLSKADEGRIGALGIASSLARVEGLVMDLGGGSTQLSWMLSRHGEVQAAEEAVSMPFGAAALTKRLQTAINDQAVEAIAKHIQEELKKAVDTLGLPPELKEKAKKEGGYTLYLSGGGFRGFGYLLLAEHEIQPYPLAIINGFSAKNQHFYDLAARIGLTLTEEQLEQLERTFRISERRAKQVPAVAFLIRQLLLSLPDIKDVVFCQGGVREGCLYEQVPPEIRAKNPLVVSTEIFKPAGAAKLTTLMNDALPKSTPEVFWLGITQTIANLWTYHASVPKEGRASAGLHFTTTGALASTHGLTHKERALLGLTLCARWGGELADSTFKDRLERLVGDEMAWWARYVGSVAYAVGSVFPAGIVGDDTAIREEVTNNNGGSDDSGSNSSRRRRHSEVDAKISFFARDLERKEHLDIILRVRVQQDDPDTTAVMVKKAVEDVEKVGKKKHCKGFRRKVTVLWEELE